MQLIVMNQKDSCLHSSYDVGMPSDARGVTGDVVGMPNDDPRCNYASH